MDPLDPLIGNTIANYQITRLLGQGGFGSVYEAEHPILHRRAAIKVMRPEFCGDSALVQRFVNEARAASSIRHRNIIEITDVGTTAEGIPYILMEFLEGEVLSARIQRLKRLEVRDAVEFAFQAADALSVAHSRGIVHRDLKPDNLYLISDPVMPDRELVKVLDFGIAKLRGEWGEGAMKTGTGSIMGTPPYMAPEQCRGLHDEIDARSDIYSLGTILFEMLCGTPPFVAKGWGDILVKHITEAPPVPSSINAEIPEHLDKVILKALEKAKDARHANMHAFQQAISPWRKFVAPDGAAVVSGGVVAPQPRDESHTAIGRVVPVTSVGSTAILTTMSEVTNAMATAGGDGDEAAFQQNVRYSKRNRIALIAGGAGLLGAAILTLSLSTPASTSSDPVPVPAGSHAAVERAPAITPIASRDASVLDPKVEPEVVEPKLDPVANPSSTDTRDKKSRHVSGRDTGDGKDSVGEKARANRRSTIVKPTGAAPSAEMPAARPTDKPATKKKTSKFW
jgi:tRNA A-37 threonylcarbamoyl transferase component Bud32